MKKLHFIIIIAFVIIMGIALAVRAAPRRAVERSVVLVGRNAIRVLTARTPAEVEKGLSGHSRMADDEGMLFFFSKADIYPFWMPEMRFPIDIIWIRNGVVQEVATLGIPVKGEKIPSHTPQAEADRVLEIGAGLAQRYGLIKGARVVLPP